jgi:hypothetical protein
MPTPLARLARLMPRPTIRNKLVALSFSFLLIAVGLVFWLTLLASSLIWFCAMRRSVLFSMIELNNGPDKPHRKCARIVGDTMGKYHPHGDSSIYGALVNMAQDWSTRYPLVDGHGNFGSVDGDGAAAMRYTEARLSRISMEMLADINKNTVDFVPNFDETEKEPVPFTNRFGNLEGNTTGSFSVSSKFGTKSTVFLLMSASISMEIRLKRASVYRIAAAPSPSTEPKFPCPSTNGYLVDQSWAMLTNAP